MRVWPRSHCEFEDEANATVTRDGGVAAEAESIAWPISAETSDELVTRARRLRDWVIGDPDASIIDIGYTLSAAPSVAPHRAVVIGRDRDGLLSALSDIEHGTISGAVVLGHAPTRSTVAFVVPAPALEIAIAARAWLDIQPVFSAWLRRAASILSKHIGVDVVDVLSGFTGHTDVESTELLEAVCFCIHVAMAAAWRNFGVRPDLIIEGSGSELAAGVIGGLFEIEDAARAFAERDRHAAGDRRDIGPRIRRKFALGVQRFVEVSPRHTVADPPPSMRAERGHSEPEIIRSVPRSGGVVRGEDFLAAVAQAYVNGVPVLWSTQFAGRRALWLTLPEPW